MCENSMIPLLSFWKICISFACLPNLLQDFFFSQSSNCTKMQAS